jgi:hypothetical protein
MTDRKKIYVLLALVGLLGAVYWLNRNSASGVAGVLAADNKFQPLNIQDPQLRLDLLEKIHKQEYTGTHRNIFVVAPLPPPPSSSDGEARPVGPQSPPPPPPVVIPATFFGYATDARTASRLAFFESGDDVFIVGEGGILLGRYRLLKIGNDSAEFEEVASARRASLPMTQPAPESPAQ